MTLHVPGEDANLVEVEGQAVFGLRQNGQVLRDLLFAVAHFIEHKVRYNALPLRVLCDLEGHVEINHSGQHPSHAGMGVPHEPPIFEDWLGAYRLGPFFFVRLSTSAHRGRCGPRLFGNAPPQ